MPSNEEKIVVKAPNPKYLLRTLFIIYIILMKLINIYLVS